MFNYSVTWLVKLTFQILWPMDPQIHRCSIKTQHLQCWFLLLTGQGDCLGTPVLWVNCGMGLMELVVGSFPLQQLPCCSVKSHWWADVKSQVLIWSCFVAMLTRQLNKGHSLDHLSPHTHTQTLPRFVWTDSENSQEEAMLQKGVWSLPCKEPLRWFFTFANKTCDSLRHFSC